SARAIALSTSVEPPVEPPPPASGERYRPEHQPTVPLYFTLYQPLDVASTATVAPCGMTRMTASDVDGPLRRLSPPDAVTVAFLPTTALSSFTITLFTCESDSPSPAGGGAPQPARPI